MCRRHHPECSIIPPHIVRKLAESSDPQVRARALQSLAIASRIRGRRDILGAIALPTRGVEGLHRTIYDAGHGTDLPGTKIRDEEGPKTGDVAADEAYDGLGTTYELYEQAFGRNSLDDHGLPLIGTVHYRQGWDNAMWDGTQMVFGDGDGQYFNRFTLAIDVIGHELTHGVTQYTAGLDYQDEPGALNESFSDVFGSLVKQYSNNQDAASADWMIGEGLFTARVQSGDPSHPAALRSMLHPGTGYNDPVLGKDPQPDNMRNYDHTKEDNGGVHINSGIPNRAFALTAVAIGGYAWEDPGMIWYKTLLRLSVHSKFQDAADMTYQVAGELFNTGSTQQQAVQEAWAQVGIRISGATPARRRRVATRSNGAHDGAGYEGQVEKLAAEVKKLREDLSKALMSGKK